jgi:hypothetical protein
MVRPDRPQGPWQMLLASTLRPWFLWPGKLSYAPLSQPSLLDPHSCSFERLSVLTINSLLLLAPRTAPSFALFCVVGESGADAIKSVWRNWVRYESAADRKRWTGGRSRTLAPPRGAVWIVFTILMWNRETNQMQGTPYIVSRREVIQILASTYTISICQCICSYTQVTLCVCVSCLSHYQFRYEHLMHLRILTPIVA